MFLCRCVCVFVLVLVVFVFVGIVGDTSPYSTGAALPYSFLNAFC